MSKKKMASLPVTDQKVKGTVGQYLESLLPQERKEFDEGYKELLISEMIIAAMENDAVSVRELAKMADISPTTVQNLRSGISDSGVKSLFKVFKSLGYSIFAEKDDYRLPLVEAIGAKTSHLAHRSIKVTKAKAKTRTYKGEIEETSTIAPRIARHK